MPASGAAAGGSHFATNSYICCDAVKSTPTPEPPRGGFITLSRGGRQEAECPAMFLSVAGCAVGSVFALPDCAPAPTGTLAFVHSGPRNAKHAARIIATVCANPPTLLPPR